MKVCTGCGKEKELDDFYKIKKRCENQTVFHTAKCKKCTDAINKQNVYKYKEYHTNYRAAHKAQMKARDEKHRNKTRKEWMSFLSNHIKLQCQKCGYNKTFFAMDFHHINPKEKEYNIYDLMRKKLTEEIKQIFLQEYKKCILLCATCHREEHATTLLS